MPRTGSTLVATPFLPVGRTALADLAELYPHSSLRNDLQCLAGILLGAARKRVREPTISGEVWQHC